MNMYRVYFIALFGQPFRAWNDAGECDNPAGAHRTVEIFEVRRSREFTGCRPGGDPESPRRMTHSALADAPFGGTPRKTLSEGRITANQIIAEIFQYARCAEFLESQ